MTATEVVMNVIGAENADAVDDKNGLSAVLKPSPFRAWRWRSSDPDTEVEKWLEKGEPCSILVLHHTPFEILMEELVLSRMKIGCDQEVYVQFEEHVTKSYVHKFAKVLR